MSEPVYVDMDVKYIEDERWDVLAAAVEALGKDAPDQALFIQNLTKAFEPYLERLEPPLQPAFGHPIHVKMGGLSKAAHSDGRIYLQRIGNEVSIG